MRKTFISVLKLFTDLRDRQKALAPEMQECLRTFYGVGRGTSLTVRTRRRPSGEIRQIYLASRSRKAFKMIGTRKVRLCFHLSGRINQGLIREVALDLQHAPQWYRADAIRIRLNERSARYASALRDLRLAMSNKFARHATLADRAALQLILESSPHLAQDSRGILGALVYDRLLQGLESAISRLVLQWKEQMKTLPFEPLIRWRASGPLRLTWAYVDRFYDAGGGIQIRSHDIPGGVTDRWLRQHHTQGGAPARKDILRYAAPLRTLTRDYSRLVVYVGRLKARVRRALSPEMNGARPVAGAAAI